MQLGYITVTKTKNQEIFLVYRSLKNKQTKKHTVEGSRDDDSEEFRSCSRVWFSLQVLTYKCCSDGSQNLDSVLPWPALEVVWKRLHHLETEDDFRLTVTSCKTAVTLPMYLQLYTTYSVYPNFTPQCLGPVNMLKAKKLQPDWALPQVASLFPHVCLGSKVESDLHYIRIVWELKYWNHEDKDTDSEHISMFHVMELKYFLSQQKC